MKLPSLNLSRQTRSGVLFNHTDNQLQLARLRLSQTPVLMDALAEVPPTDGQEVERWTEAHVQEKDSRGRLPAYCGFHPVERVIARVQINTRRLAEPDYLAALVAEQAKITSAKEWLIRVLNPMDGTPLTNDGTIRPGLLFGVPWSAIRVTQERLLDLGLRPRGLEVTTLPLLGILTQHIAQTGYRHAVAVCEIERDQTRVYIIAKDGIHTLSPLPFGLASVIETAMKELSTPDLAAARAQLEEPDEFTLEQGRRLVRLIARHLKPAVDQFELQTGHRIDELYCGQVPDRLHWLCRKLGEAVDLPLLEPALQAASVHFLTEGAAVGQQWLAALSLLTTFNLTPAGGSRAPTPVADLPAAGAAWHFDCRLVAELPEDSVVGTRFLINAIFGGITLGIGLGAGWLAYTNFELRRQVNVWEKRMADNAQVLQEIAAVQRDFARDSARLDEAYNLMHQPMAVSELTTLLGESRPAQVTFELIETGGPEVIVLRGSLRDSSERASRLLGAYVDQLRAHPRLGPLCREIVLTSLERRELDDSLSFEITFRLHAPATPAP
ncbi:MAG: hypothetical protein KF897_02030 [Opitutaceae bacterium]|nr:hypothetical protein [Opitutaceae bacterium]